MGVLCPVTLPFWIHLWYRIL